MRNSGIAFVIGLIAMVIPIAAGGQCKSFVKKQCLPMVAPYTHNGQLNTAMMAAGQTAELQMTFYSGQEYRILICGQEALGKLWFRLVDANKNEVFNSKNQKNSPNVWDFKMKSTQQISIEIHAPESDSPNELVPSGCVSLLVGFKR
jgi:hypothetical protein